jgi:DNA modification methylase
MKEGAMSKSSKFIITTSRKKKRALRRVLRAHQQTLGEWFDEQLESFVSPQDLVPEIVVSQADTSADLVNPDQVVEDLQSVDWAFTEDDTGYLTHDIHPYSAKFIPQIPANLIARLSLPGELVLDPFTGSGTTAVEAVRLGRRAVCIDANPLSELIGRVKTGVLSLAALEELENLRSHVLSFSNSITSEQDSIELAQRYSDQVPDIPNIDHWFSAIAVGELSLIRYLIRQLNNAIAQDVALISFSKIITRVSYQDSETRYAQNKKEIPSGSVLSLFVRELESVRCKLQRASSVLRYGSANFYTFDSRKIPDSVLPEGSVDLLVTSPPYPNAHDYHLYHRFRIFWIGSDPRDLGSIEIGSHLKHQRDNTGFKNYLSDMRACLGRFEHVLRPGRYAVFVVGDGVYKGEIYRTSKRLTEVAQEMGFEFCGDIERPIHKTRRSFSKPARRARSESILILRKRPRKVQIQVLPPNYQMWQYEEVLRGRELASIAEVNCEDAMMSGPIDIVVDWHTLPNLRRLTFSHGVEGEDYTLNRTWQAVLENGNNNQSARKEPKYATHGIHAYKGKFYPQLVKSLINISGAPLGSTVLDPFCGSGTTILEAFLNGMKGIGCDMHPLAVKISNAKVGILATEPAQCEESVGSVIASLRSIEEVPEDTSQFRQESLKEVFSWFPEPVVYKLNTVLTVIRAVDTPVVREFLEVVLSSIVREVSQQDPRDLRIRRRKPPIEDASVMELFVDALEEQLQRLRAFWQVMNYWPVHPQLPRVLVGDSRVPDTFTLIGLDKQSVDLVVTSPPYATALPYIDTDRLSLLTLFGMTSSDRRELEYQLTGSREIRTAPRTSLDQLILDPPEDTLLPSSVFELLRMIYQLNEGTDAGFRRLNKPALLLRYFNDMAKVFVNLTEVISPSGDIFVVIGDNHTKAGGRIVEIRTTQLLKDIAMNCGLLCVEELPISVTTENMKHIRHAITENTILRFRLAKPE